MPTPDPGCLPSLRHNICVGWKCDRVAFSEAIDDGSLRAGGCLAAVAVIQVGPPFAEHRHTLLGVQGADTVPVHFGEDWKFAARRQSRVVAPSVASLPRHAQQAHSLLQRYEVRDGYPAFLAMPSLPTPRLHRTGPQRNEHAPSLLALDQVCGSIGLTAQSMCDARDGPIRFTEPHFDPAAAKASAYSAKASAVASPLPNCTACRASLLASTTSCSRSTTSPQQRPSRAGGSPTGAVGANDVKN